jgi:hypothetical protein
MIGKGSGNEPETDPVQRFGASLSWHLDRGTRPEGAPHEEGVPWTAKEFAGAVRADERSVRAWRGGKNLPKDLRAIEKELFGDNQAYRDFRDQLRRLYRQARSGAEIESRAENRGEAGSGGRELSLPGQDTFDLLANEFKQACAFFQVAGGQTVLFAQAEKALAGFREAINRLWTVHKADARERILIWTVDLGRQDFEDPESLTRFMNVQALINRFKALKLFKESDTEARWKWLQSRTVIVLHDTRSVRPEVPRLPAFDPHHVLFSAIPPKWAGSPEFLELYGHERLQQTNYTIFLRSAAEEFPEATKRSDNISSPEHRSYTLRYFGNTLLRSGEKGEQEMRGIELKAPGRSYVEALGTTYLAAAQMLGLRSTPTELFIDGMKIDSMHATEKLRHHGFRLHRLDEFLNL